MVRAAILTLMLTHSDCTPLGLQGVPLGLSMGSVPFLLKAKASFTQIGARDETPALIA